MPRYHIKVYRDGAKERLFRYRVELHDSEKKSIHPYNEKPTRVAYDWCAYQFMINRTAKKLVKEQLGKNNEKLVSRFRLVV